MTAERVAPADRAVETVAPVDPAAQVDPAVEPGAPEVVALAEPEARAVLVEAAARADRAADP